MKTTSALKFNGSISVTNTKVTVTIRDKNEKRGFYHIKENKYARVMVNTLSETLSLGGTYSFVADVTFHNEHRIEIVPMGMYS